VWFRPGSRHLFDRRTDVHDATTARDFLTAYDALIGSVLEKLVTEADIKRMFERQARWQEIFTKYDISHLVLKKRGGGDSELVRRLLLERDPQNNPVWRPLQLHNGQIYALAWTRSPHWAKLQALELNPERTVFMRDRPVGQGGMPASQGLSFARFLMGDPSRRPPSLDESAWHLFNINNNSTSLAAGGLARSEVMSLPFHLMCRLASPLNTLPFFPRILSNRQGSAASIYLSLDAARRAVTEITPETSAFFRAEVWLQYFQTVTALSEYEQSFSPLASRYREPLRLFVLRQSALAAADASHGSTFVINMELAKSYQALGLLDAALAHTLLAKSHLERQPGEEMARVVKNLDATVKQMFGFAPTELQNAVKQQMERWQQTVTQQGWLVAEGGDTARDALNRARVALQLGLPQKALEEIIQSNVKSIEAAEMAMAIYSAMGQNDIVLEEFLNRLPELRQRLGEVSYHDQASLGEWCQGRPERAALHRLESLRMLNQRNVQSLLEASQRGIFGTSSNPVGNVLPSTYMAQQSASETFGLADQVISAGLLYLEAGKPHQAADLFIRAIKEFEPETQWRLLLERYYLQITGEILK
jgi:tetratricopeptide (TPR) repeat protein